MKIKCPIKINLTLHVLNTRANGYHELRSLFWKKTGSEILNITESNLISQTGTRVVGAEIKTKNLVDLAIEFAGHYADFPELSVLLEKNYPQGSGVGAGSGNAAGMLIALKEKYGYAYSAEELAPLGADVAFLAQSSDVCFASGVGEILSPSKSVPDLHWILAFPSWQFSTVEAYRKLDEVRSETNIYDFYEEAENILVTLCEKEKIGLLPNDFLTVAMNEHKEYEKIFVELEISPAKAYGMCGSGSSIFAVYDTEQEAEEIEAILKKIPYIIFTERVL